MAVYQGPQREQEECSKFTIQEPKETFQTLKQLRNVKEELQRQHNIRNDTTAQYGSLWVCTADTACCIWSAIHVYDLVDKLIDCGFQFMFAWPKVELFFNSLIWLMV